MYESCLLYMKQLNYMQVEVVISCFARLTDWVGFRALVYDNLGKTNRLELERRLGFFNLFQEHLAVGYWVLDLADEEQRRVLQDLIYLGDEEPGRNFVEVMYNDRDFQVPAGWLKSVPDRGIIALHYCREKDTCTRIQEAFVSTLGAWPHGYRQKHGIEWVQFQRLKIIKDKLKDKFPTGYT